LIFIDCGKGDYYDATDKDHYERELLNSLKYPGKKLRDLFKGISVCEVFITHNHADHTNLLGSVIVPVGQQERCYVLTSIGPMSKGSFVSYPKDPKMSNKPSRARMLEIEGRDFRNVFSPRIRNSLGSYVRVVPIRPEQWMAISVPPHEHEFNIMYLVEFAGRRILFTGDINPQLFTRIMQNPKYEREIKAVDFLVVPHHGSNRSGELMTEVVVNPEMCIICSDPKAKDNLPWSEVANFPVKHRRDVVTRMHSVSRRKEESGNKLNKDVKTQEETLPVFVTCDAKQGYYELVITADGTATLFDGLPGKSPVLFRSL
jgi:metal-dependent hydrolase (beta-lactamase superfamily II)